MIRLPQNTRITVHLRLAFVCTICLGVLTILVALGVEIPGDAELVRLVVSTRNEALTRVIWLLTFISSSVPALLITLAVSGVELWRVKRFKLSATWATLAYAGAVVCNIALRIAVGRMRPAVDYIPHMLPEVQASFQRFSYPSGHAGAAVLAYSSLVALAWSRSIWRWLLLVIALLIIAATGFGRVYMGVHWPTDVLAGYLLGGCWLGIGMALKRRAIPENVEVK
jgi:membrane-associated phospholipid phosphatase